MLPQFAGSFAGLTGCGAVLCLLTLAWLTGYSFAVARASALLHRPRARRSVEALTGTVLVALGLRLATKQCW